MLKTENITPLKVKAMKREIYEPNKYLKLGARIWPTMFSELKDCQDLIWHLFKRDLIAKYKQSVLGCLWVVIMPFVAIGTFMYLNRAGILNIGDIDMPYPLYALIGLTVFQLFSTGLASGCNSLVSAGDMITKINFPRESLVFASFSQAIFEFLIKSGLIFILFIVYKFIPSWPIVFFPLCVAPLIILTVGLSLILSLVNGVLRDTANVVVLLTSFLMFLTPVLYPLPEEKFYLFKLNLLIPLVNAPRDLIVYGAIQNPLDYFVASIVAVLVFFISWRIFHLAETKIPERV